MASKIMLLSLVFMYFFCFMRTQLTSIDNGSKIMLLYVHVYLVVLISFVKVGNIYLVAFTVSL
jgi:hypothetical protein